MTSDDQGFVLHTRPYREASQLVTLFTENHGRFNAVSRATRNRRSGNQLRPFCLLRFCWRGRSDLKTLESVDTVAVPTTLAGAKLFVGFYLNELLTRLVHEHDPYPALFDRYARALTILATTEEVEPMLRYFELKLLEDLGYGLCLDVDMESDEPVAGEQQYLFFPGEGVRLSRRGDPAAYLFPGEHLLAISALTFDDPGVLKSAKRLTRLAMEPYLGNRPLASRELFRGGGTGRAT